MSPEFLKQVPLFEGLTDRELAGILLLGLVKEYAENDVIFDENAPGDRFFVIYEGSVRISRHYETMGEEALTILGPGEFLGEMSFFDGEARSARALAHAPAKLLEIRNEPLKDHLNRHPDVALKFLWAFARTLSRRVRETNDKFSTLFAISRVF